jgi:hypothetical protein
MEKDFPNFFCIITAMMMKTGMDRIVRRSENLSPRKPISNESIGNFIVVNAPI